MGCLRNGAIVALTTFLGALLGTYFGDSLLPVPGWLVRMYVRDGRVDAAIDLARTAGKVWGGLNGAFAGLLVGAVVVAFLILSRRQRPAG